MMKAARLGAVVFYVKDLARTEAFYRDVLGLETQIVAGHDGDAEPEGPFLRSKAGDVSLIFFKKDEPPGKTPVVVFGLAGGIDDFYDQLVAKGAQIVLPVSHAPGGWTFDFVDPDGHALSFYQSNGAPRRG